MHSIFKIRNGKILWMRVDQSKGIGKLTEKQKWDDSGRAIR